MKKHLRFILKKRIPVLEYLFSKTSPILIIAICNNLDLELLRIERLVVAYT